MLIHSNHPWAMYSRCLSYMYVSRIVAGANSWNTGMCSHPICMCRMRKHAIVSGHKNQKSAFQGATCKERLSWTNTDGTHRKNALASEHPGRSMHAHALAHSISHLLPVKKHLWVHVCRTHTRPMCPVMACSTAAAVRPCAGTSGYGRLTPLHTCRYSRPAGKIRVWECLGRLVT